VTKLTYRLIICILTVISQFCAANPPGGSCGPGLGFKTSRLTLQPPKYYGEVKRLYISPYISTNVTSSATTNNAALKDDESGKWNFGLRLGYRFWITRSERLMFSLESGAIYRDFGFSQNQSTIPYLAIPGTIRVAYGKGFFKVNFYGSLEFNRIVASRYHYVQPNDPSNSRYNLFLHSNDALTGLYGVGLSFGKKNFRLEVFTENISQIDNYDLQFGKTIGARTLGCAVHISLL
jgi:hypothetical protein